MKILRLLSWLLRAGLFLLLLLFALKNTDAVTLVFFFDRSWQVPLVLLLLAFLLLGAVLGLLACTARLFTERRQILALQRELRSVNARQAAARLAAVDVATPPPPDVAG